MVFPIHLAPRNMQPPPTPRWLHLRKRISYANICCFIFNLDLCKSLDLPSVLLVYKLRNCHLHYKYVDIVGSTIFPRQCLVLLLTYILSADAVRWYLLWNYIQLIHGCFWMGVTFQLFVFIDLTYSNDTNISKGYNCVSSYIDTIYCIYM